MSRDESSRWRRLGCAEAVEGVDQAMRRSWTHEARQAVTPLSVAE
jgi:hypothetical protein